MPTLPFQEMQFAVNVEGVDKGEIYEGAVIGRAAGMNDNITERIIKLRIWEKIE